MDFSILYRILYSPSSVFENCGGKPRPEPFVIIGIFGVLSTMTLYIGDGRFFNSSILWILGLPIALFLLLLKPIIETCFIYLLAYYIFITQRHKFNILLNIFIICTIPFYIEVILIRFFASILSHKNYAIAYFIINPIKASLYYIDYLSPFLIGMLSIFSLSFIWTIILWRVALTHLFKLRSLTTVGIVICLIILNMLIGGIIGFVPHVISRCHIFM